MVHQTPNVSQMGDEEDEWAADAVASAVAPVEVSSEEDEWAANAVGSKEGGADRRPLSAVASGAGGASGSKAAVGTGQGCSHERERQAEDQAVSF